MATHIVIDGNAFYEVDEECLKRREEKAKAEKRRPEKKRPGERPGAADPGSR